LAINDSSINYQNTSGNTWTASYTVDSSDSNGSVSYTIDYKDLADNSGTTISSGSGSVTIDTVNPTLSGVSLASNNAISTLAKADDVVTLTFTASETIEEPTVVFQSNGQSINDSSITYQNTSGNTWTASYTVFSGDSNGSVSYTIYYNDLAGNDGSTVSTGSGSVTIDTNPPTITSITPSWGSYLNSTEDNSDGSVNVQTSNVEDGQTLTISLNSINYTGTISSNSTTITISSTDLQALIDGLYLYNKCGC